MKLLIKGGGIAGCVAGICALLNGYEVLLFESKKMPRHKVCGEYVSLESVPILEQLLGITLRHYPIVYQYRIQDLISSQVIMGHLPLGGFGISRYEFDALLMNRFTQLGGLYHSEQRIVEYAYCGNQVKASLANGDTHLGDLYIDASGKSPCNDKADAYIGLKYHIYDNLPDPTIRLFLFAGGYFGTSSVENGKRCVCFLIRQQSITGFNKPIDFARQILIDAKLELYSKPDQSPLYVISNFHFKPSHQINSIGDAKQLVPPLAGNGMSIAIADGLKLLDQTLGPTEKTDKRKGIIQQLHHIAYKPFGASLLTSSFAGAELHQTLIGATHGHII